MFTNVGKKLQKVALILFWIGIILSIVLGILLMASGNVSVNANFGYDYGAAPQRVSGIIPVLSDRCISRPDEKTFEKKLYRYKDICREAAQQCGRGVIPQIFPLVDFKKAVCSLPDNAAGIFCYEKEKDTSLRRVLSGIKGKEIHVFIGPEGGFSDAESELAARGGLVSVTFGERILRCETAPVYFMSAVSYEFG